MKNKICINFKACAASDALYVTKSEIALKPGKSFFNLKMEGQASFSIRNYDTVAGYRKDFAMQLKFVNADTRLLYKNKRALLLLLTTNLKDTIAIGTIDFPVKAEFAGDENITIVDFKQSEPG